MKLKKTNQVQIQLIKQRIPQIKPKMLLKRKIKLLKIIQMTPHKFHRMKNKVQKMIMKIIQMIQMIQIIQMIKPLQIIHNPKKIKQLKNK